MNVRGVIGMDGIERGKAPKLSDLFIDVGATDQDSCPVRNGDVCGFDRPFLDLGKRMVAKSMDDRIAAVIAIEVIKQLESTPMRFILCSAHRKRSAYAVLLQLPMGSILRLGLRLM